MKVLEVCFDTQDLIYKDHFPGMPIVPGTLILDTISSIMKMDNLQFERVRFKHFMKPSTYKIIISKKRIGFQFSIKKEDKTYASGTFRKSK